MAIRFPVEGAQGGGGDPGGPDDRTAGSGALRGEAGGVSAPHRSEQLRPVHVHGDRQGGKSGGLPGPPGAPEGGQADPSVVL